MTDRLTPERRSALMSRIRGKDTKPELTVRRLIFSLGYRYRLHDRKLPGSPDIVFKGKKKVIFVHGCFWHSHGCKKGKPPKGNLDYWLPKLNDTKKRDKKSLSELASMGWKTLVIWQCELKDIEELENRIINFIS